MTSVAFNHIAINCKDPILIERFYTKHFGFRRSRVYLPGPGQVVVIKSGPLSLELFPAKGDRPSPVERDGTEYPGIRHVAFLVDDLDAKLAAMGSDATLSLDRKTWASSYRACEWHGPPIRKATSWN